MIIPITKLLSCHKKAATFPANTVACIAPQANAVGTLFKANSLGGYPAAPFRTVPVTAISRKEK